MNNENEQMRTKLEFYFEKQIIIHIRCLNGRFYNGIIMDLTPSKQLLVFKDNKLGAVPILFEEIFKIEPYENKKEVKG